MKLLTGAFLVCSILVCGGHAQDPQKVPLRKGVSVQMAVARDAAEIRQADEPDATVVAITADGKVYNGITVTEPGALSSLSAGTVYVKADARAPYQKVLSVLDALRGKSVVLLTAPPQHAAPTQGIVAPYGVKLTVSR